MLSTCPNLIQLGMSGRLRAITSHLNVSSGLSNYITKVYDQVKIMEKKYKLLLLADTAAPHTRRWANWFAKNGWEVHIVSFNQQMFGGYKDVEIHLLWKSRQFTSGFFFSNF